MTKRNLVLLVLLTGWTAVAAVSAAPAGSPSKKPTRVGSYSKLLKLIKAHQPRYFAGYRTGLGAMTFDSPAAPASASGGTGATKVSSTLTQVTGVDEGDEAKNNGSLICQINQGRVLILKAYPDSEAGVLSTLDFTDGSFFPQELYLDGSQLVIVGTAFQTPSRGGPVLAPIWYFSTSTVEAKVYDLSDPAKPAKQREIEVDGDFVASRKIGSCLYLVARQYPDYYAEAGSPTSSVRRWHTRAPSTRALVPSYRDSKLGRKRRALGLKRCFYFPEFDDPVYLVVAGLDLSARKSSLDVNAFLGAGEQVYSSVENLYVAGSRPFDIYLAPVLSMTAGPAVEGATGAASAVGQIGAGTPVDPVPSMFVPLFPEQTDIYKIGLTNGHSKFIAANSVTGSVVNAYSMDEYNGYLRVASTEHSWWSADFQEHNHVTVFDPSLQLAGGVDDLAPGERIYAARFVGNRGFLVTFQQIDPLFALDLSDPTNPVVAGQLSLPGYSSFLLPYDENHLIGFGKDVQITSGTNASGDVPWWDGQAFYQGMRLTLFDVTDLTNPLEMSSVSIGDRGTDSPALYDPHAILFDASSGLLAFPIGVAQVSEPDPTQPWQWGDTIFQGAYVYNVTLDSGFTFKGAITHKPLDQDVNATWGDEIDRVMMIGPDIYTLSDQFLKANDAGTLAEKASVSLPQPPNNPYPILVPVIH